MFLILQSRLSRTHALSPCAQVSAKKQVAKNTPEAALADNLLNFSIDGGEESPGKSDGFSTPTAGRTAPLSASSASWVAEMNQDIAEFDAITSGIQQAAGGLSKEMEAELANVLASPVEGSGVRINSGALYS